MALLPCLDAAGVDDFHAIGFGRAKHPGTIGAQLLAVVGRDLLQNIMIVAEQEKEAFVDDRRVLKLLVSVASTHRRKDSIKRSSVTHSIIALAGRVRTGQA